MKMKFLIALLFVGFFARAQEGALLKPEDVIKLTIENNFDIQIAKNNTEIAKNSNNIGASGMLPTVTLNANPSSSNNNINQKFSNGTEIERSGVSSSNVSASLTATWYFFDGLKMFATRKKLNKNEELSNLQFRQTLESTLLNALSSYYRMISIQELIRSLEVSLQLTGEQKKLAAEKLKAGTGSNVEVLQTQVDHNNIQVQIMQQQNLLNAEKANLNKIFKRAPETNFSVPDTILIQTKPEYENAAKSLEEKNSSILVSTKNVEISELVLKEFRGNRYPRVGVIGNYALNRNQNQAGFSLLNQSLGYTLGLTASWTLLNNLTTHTAIKNQLVQISSEKVKLEAARLTERTDLFKAWYDFQNNLAIMEIEKQSASLANENLSIAMQRFKLGLSNFIEYRMVQKSYEETIYRLSDASYKTKISELTYLKVQGLLVR